jgi:hyperosmotically inducible protein
MHFNSTLKIGILSLALIASAQTFAKTNNDANATTPNSKGHEKMIASTPKEDAVVTKAIEKLIKKSATLSNLDVKVSTSKGVVSLEGTVDADTQFSRLVELAESVNGVADVNTSNLKVKGSDQPVADTITTAKVRGILIREALFGEKDVEAIKTAVETKNGVVYLSGEIDNKQQIDNAVELIKKSLPEVKKIEYSVHKFTPADNNKN